MTEWPTLKKESSCKEYIVNGYMLLNRKEWMIIFTLPLFLFLPPSPSFPSFINFFLKIFLYLDVLGLSCSMWDILVMACELLVVACWIYLPDLGSSPGPPLWWCGVTGPPEKSLLCFFPVVVNVNVSLQVNVVVQSFSRSVVSDSLWSHGLWSALQASLSFIISWSLLKLMSIESVMASNHLVLCCYRLIIEKW